MKSNGSLLYSLILVVGDFLALVAAFVGAYLLRVSFNSKPISEPIYASTYLGIFLTLLPFWILLFALLGLYNSSIYEKRFSEIGRLFIGSFIGVLFLIGYSYFLNKPVFPARLVAIYGLVLAFIFLVLFRNIARWGRSLLFSYNFGITNVLIVGDTKIARELVESLANSRDSGYKILGIIGEKAAEAKHFNGIPTFSDLEKAIKKIKPGAIHGIVQTELYASTAKNNEVLEFAQAHHIAYRFIPGNTELFVGNIQVELFRSSIPVIAVHQTALLGWGRIVKRIFDLAVGLIALVIALPIMLVVTILNLILNPGPVFYADKRLTRFNTTIKVYKFRSIKRQFSGLSPEEAFHKIGRPELVAQYRDNGDWLPDDPRINDFGRFIRRNSLDELPQLFNIVKGDISLVGPRALVDYELSTSPDKNMILAVKSGLTGLAQVSGRRNLSFDERRKLDLYYVQNWSFWLDLTIILKTIRVVLGRRGAT